MARTTVEAQLAKLRKQREAIEAKEKALQAKANDKDIAEIVALAKKHKVTIEELAAALGKTKAQRTSKSKTKAIKSTDKRAKVVPKYRNPDDAAQTWTGRGKSPLWIQALKTAGKLEAALIAAE